MKKLILKFIAENNLLDQLWVIIRVCWSALGTVYLWGKMLGLVQSHFTKNLVAGIFMIINMIGITYFNQFGSDKIYLKWWFNVYITISIGFTLYVWFFWRASDRIDSFLDQKGFKDKLRYIMGRKKKKNKGRKL